MRPNEVADPRTRRSSTTSLVESSIGTEMVKPRLRDSTMCLGNPDNIQLQNKDDFLLFFRY